ncbi:MAG: SDR family oxidoreductase [Cyanobacteriota bacterium]|nr:SDR family oxidoreductase [Cyanobacteriota bacterium]
MSVAFITGASRGIGLSAARCFAEAGYSLLLVARPSSEFNNIAEAIRSTGCRVETAGIDLSDPAAIEPGVHELCSRGLEPSIVVNNAGAAWTGPLCEMPIGQWQRILQINLTSVFQICQAVVPLLRKAGGGLIVNVSSHAARNAFPDWGAYCASKAALASFSRCLAEEERIHGIRVSTLTLGSVNTPLWESETVQSNFDRRAMLSADQVARTLLFLAEQPHHQVVEDLTLMPAVGAF